jgi:F-type H+-transporting ATPase subunit b
MTSWLLLAEAGASAAGTPEGGLFDLDATLPLMALQVVILTFILNALFFRPVGKAVEDREGYIVTSRAEAKEKLAQAERLEADLKAQLKDARLESQRLIVEAEQEVDRLYRAALAEATAEANASREKARREIDAERDTALSQLVKDADDLGELIVSRLLAAS